MERKSIVTYCIQVLWAIALPALGADGASLAAKGTQNVPACATCHGARGEGQAASGFPRLAGQSSAYLAKQLADFAAGRRKNPIMEPIAKALDPQNIEAVSKYYQDLGGGTSPLPAHDEAQAPGPGAQLAHRGNWDRDIPACFACHGDGGAGIPPHFPAIAGQNRQYTVQQIHAWKAGQRSNDPQGLMKAVADKLTDAQIDAVAAYLERLAPAAGQGER